MRLRILTTHLLTAFALCLSTLQAKPLKVFILAGQSNMQGHSAFRVLDHLKEDSTTAPFYEAIKDENGERREINRVWISYLNEGSRKNGRIVSSIVKSGPLQHGYGARGDGDMGPELGFGITMRELYDGPILIIKAAFGGTSLHTDWRPPSAGPWTMEEISADYRKHMERKGIDPKNWLEQTNKQAGFLYRWMIDHAREVLNDPSQVVPGYNPQDGYEIAGFVWFQGTNDTGGPSYFKGPGGHAKYTDYLAHMIRDIRRDLNAPKMRASVAVMEFKSLDEAQSAIEEVSDLKGTVTTVPIRPFVDPVIRSSDKKHNGMKVARNKWKKETNWRQKEQAARNESGEAFLKLKEVEKEWVDNYLRENMTPEEYHAHKNYVSALGFHFSGSAKFFVRAGDAFARALIPANTK